MGLLKEMTFSTEKSKKRKEFKQLRAKQMPAVQEPILKEVERELNRLSQDDLGGYIGLYWPLDSEIDLRDLKRLTRLPLALPASRSDGNLDYHPWNINKLEIDFCNIPAPISEKSLKAESMRLLLVPALAIDHNGIRLGYGRGFFDRLRSQEHWRSVPALAVLPGACVSLSPLPRDTWDIPFNGWISENGVSKSSKAF